MPRTWESLGSMPVPQSVSQQIKDLSETSMGSTVRSHPKLNNILAPQRIESEAGECLVICGTLNTQQVWLHTELLP